MSSQMLTVLQYSMCCLSTFLKQPRCYMTLGRRITFGHRAFSVAGPMVWNSLPTEFRDLSVGFDVFRRTVKTILFARY